MSAIEPPKKEIHALYDIGTISQAKSCPKCHSIFLSDDECEACGYQLKIDLLGEPFGYRSFFSLKEGYEFIHPWTFRFLLIGVLKENSAIKKYRGVMERRLTILVNYFILNDDSDDKRRLFIFEAREIIQEYWHVHGKLSRLWRRLEPLESHPLFHILSNDLVEFEKRPHPTQEWKSFENWKNALYEARLWGLIPMTFALKLFLGMGAVLAASYLVLKVLTAS